MPRSLAGILRSLDEMPRPLRYMPNPSTTIEYAVGQTERGTPSRRVHLAVYNSLGQKVRTLVDRIQAAGSHQVTWDGRDDSGQLMATGVYYFRLVQGDRMASRKMLFLK